MARSTKLYRSLYFQVLVAIAIGILLGVFYPQIGAEMKPLGDGFIKLIKMMIAPIIFCTVVLGIAGMEDMKKVGTTGGFALLYFEVMSTVALVVGLTIINLVRPGSGMNIDPSTLDAKAIAAYAEPGKLQSTTDFLLNVIPASVVDAFAKGEILQVLFFAVLFGFALHKFGGKSSIVY
ncbi:MAG: cation:dicarboxylate symporter family transporter, partial [Pyrinomonadaceae bacterium]